MVYYRIDIFTIMKLKSYFWAVLFCLFFSTSNAQEPNLCGIWLGYGYQCYTLDTNGNQQYYTVPLEIIAINQVVYTDTLFIIGQDSVFAVKITGDSCVPAGNATFTGEFVSGGIIDALGVAGNPNAPACCSSPMTVWVHDSTHLSFDIVYLVKATCKQIDSLGIDITQWLTDCDICKELIGVTEQKVPSTPPYPNPTDQHIYFDFPGQLKKAELRIYNSIGATVSSIPVVNTTRLTVDTSTLASGIYSFSIISNGNLEKTGKFIVTR